MIKENKRLILIFLIAFGLRLIPFFIAGSWRNDVSESRITLSDSIAYTKIALNLVKNKTFSRSELPPYQPELYFTPVYPFFLASIYIISGYKPYIPVFLQLLIGSATCLLIYKIGKILFDEKTALFSGIILAFEYSSIFYSNVLLTETLFTFLFIVHIFFLIKFLMSDSKRYLAYSAFFLGLSTLTRPVSVYFFLFLIVIILVYYKNNLIKGILKYSAFTLIFLMALAPWIARNYVVSGKFFVSATQAEILAWSIYANFERFNLEKDPPQEEDKIQGLSSEKVSKNENSKKNSPDAVKLLSSRYLFATLRATLRFFLNPGSSSYPRLLGFPYAEMEIEDIRNTPWESVKFAIQKKSILERFIFFFCFGFLLFLYFMMSVGVFRAVRGKKVKELLLIVIIITYFTIASVSVSLTGRYRVPIMPYVILLSCYGVLFLWGVFKNRKT